MIVPRMLLAERGGRDLVGHGGAEDGSSMHHLNAAARQARGARRKPDQPAEVPLILIVDDFDATRELYGRFLSSSGFRVALAANGLEALEKASSILPALVIMDVAMPGMDGWEAIRQIKADARTKHARVIVITASAYGGGPEKARRAGCDAYLLKPCLPETLLEVVRRLFASDGTA